MPVNLQQYRGVVGAFNSRFNHNNIQNCVFHRKPNTASIASAYFTITINFFHVSVSCKFLFDCPFRDKY